MTTLCSLAEYKVYTSTTDNSQDALITSLLDISTTQIQNYCDRIFLEDTYIEWLSLENCSNMVYPRQYPINKILYLGYPDTALTIINTSGTESYMIDISNNILTVSTNDLTEEEFDFTDTDFDTLTELAASIESAFADLTITVNSLVNQNSKFLKSASYSLEEGGEIEVIGAHSSSSKAEIDSNLVFLSGYDSDNIVAYKAGYAVIPEDLKNICAQVTQDALNVAIGAQNSNIKSESITNYSYSLADKIDFKSIVNGYSDALAAYKRINF